MSTPELERLRDKMVKVARAMPAERRAKLRASMIAAHAVLMDELFDDLEDRAAEHDRRIDELDLARWWPGSGRGPEIN